MGRRDLFLVLVGYSLCGFSASAKTDLTFPISADSIQRYFDSHPQSDANRFLKDLPTAFTDNFVLVHHSRSLQQATYEKPRLIFFGPDARFLLAVGSVPTDPRFSTLEFAEFDEGLGSFHYGEIDLSTQGTPKISTDVKVCTACHGLPTRPIWAQYPNWSGAYSDEAGAISTEDGPGFAQFLSSRVNDPRYSSLPFSSGPDGKSFFLPSRAYPYPNTDMNHELGNTIALGTLTRLHQDKNFETDKWAVLATSDAFDCIETDAWFDIAPKIRKLYSAGPSAHYPDTSLLFVEGLRLLGIDPDLELSLESSVLDLADPKMSRTYGQWQTGAFRLDEALAFDLLVETIPGDSQLSSLFSKENDTMKEIASWTTLVGQARADVLKTSETRFDFFDVFDPINNSKTTHETLCSYFSSHL